MNNKIIIFISVIILIILLAIPFISKKDNNENINEYKRTLYNSIYCQYSCPLENREINGELFLLPLQDCVNECTRPTKLFNSDEFSDQELANDNLIFDVARVTNECKILNANNSTLGANSKLFFPCVQQNLENLKKSYSYLNQ